MKDLRSATRPKPGEASPPPATASSLPAPAGAPARPPDAGRGGWVLTLLLVVGAAGLGVFNYIVCQRARAFLVAEPGSAYDALVLLAAIDLGALVAASIGFFVSRAGERRRRRERVADLEDALARAQSVFDNALDAVLTLDARGRVLAVNKAATTVLRRPAADIIGKPVHRVVRCGAADEEGRFKPLALDSVVCTDALSPEGKEIPVELSLRRTGEDGNVTYAAVMRDVTERVEAEERVRSFAQGLEVSNRRLEEANAQLEEASRLKSEFLANTSHELRTPLNGMIGFLQLVLDGMCDTKEEERDFLTQALQCSRNLLGLINDVLDIAKIEAGKLTLEVEAIDVRAIFGEVYTLTHVQAAQKGLALKFEQPEGDCSPVRGDFGKVKQVLVNLVGNSLKFTSHGSITVRAVEHADLGHYLFEITDTGIGIPLDRQRLIFEKFTQGDGSTTRKYGGTGLGLAISRSLVELMGGIIGVESPGEGKGTRMYFSLPVWRPEEEDAMSEDASDAAHGERDRIEGPVGGPLVLTVEDDRVFTKYLSTLLHHHGYRTVAATSAESAWILVRRLRPSIMVLDYALTSAQGASMKTGWDLAERMANDPRTRHIPLIFVTGFDLMLKERLKGTALARSPEHLMKPVDGGALVQKIEELMGSAHEGLVRILMADDDPSVSAYVRKVLPEDRFLIEVANNGEECLHVLRMQPKGFDLLMLDLMMPDVSGYDVLRELSLNGKDYADLQVLILTNFPEARDDEEKRLLERGLVLDVLAKSAVHENPALLPHIIDWHVQVQRELAPGPSGEAATTADSGPADPNAGTDADRKAA